MKKELLSIVVISKNESKVIEKSLKSIINSIKGINDFEYELIIVDSSTDKTKEIAKNILINEKLKYRIIDLKSEKYTAALSRKIGKDQSKGDFILFLDADMILYKNFIKYGIDYLNKNQKNNVIGCIGKRFDVFFENEKISNFVEFKGLLNNGFNIGGGFLINNKLLKVLSVDFNENLYVREESDFAYKLLKKGYIFKKINNKMFIHYNYKNSKRNIIDKLNLGSIKLGISLSYLIRTKSLNKKYLFKEFLLPLIFIFTIIFSMLKIPLLSLFLFVIYISFYRYRFLSPIVTLLNLMIPKKNIKYKAYDVSIKWFNLKYTY